jgi:hypothetical protein
MINKLYKVLLIKLLIIVSRLENKLWKKLYIKKRK